MITRFSILPFYVTLEEQWDNYDYMQGQVWPLISENKRMPPFQIIRTTPGSGGENINQVLLYRVEDGSYQNITATATGTGLSKEIFDTYNIIRYYPTSDLDIITPEGQYYIKLTVGNTVYWSEKFYICHELKQFIKLSYWHDEPFLIPGGHLTYADPFLNYIYLTNRDLASSVINKPGYPSQDVVNERDGFEFPHYFVSKKRYRFSVPLPEFMIDVLRIVRHHHFKQIEWNSRVFNPCYFTFTPHDEWVALGNVTTCSFEFEEAADVVTTTGKVKPESEGFSYDQEAYDDSSYH